MNRRPDHEQSPDAPLTRKEALIGLLVLLPIWSTTVMAIILFGRFIGWLFGG